MKILISNDDGCQAPGILCLAKVLKEIADVVIAAPDRNRSGASNSLTLERPLRVKEMGRIIIRLVVRRPIACISR